MLRIEATNLFRAWLTIVTGFMHEDKYLEICNSIFQSVIPREGLSCMLTIRYKSIAI